MTVSITLSEIGSDAGPSFNLYSSPDGTTFTSIIDGITKTELEAGYTATVPDGTTIIRVTSDGDCTNSEDLTITTAGCNITSQLTLAQGTSSVDACTNFGIPDNRANYYTSNGFNFANASFLNYTPNCAQPAGSGWYSDGIISREYNSSTGSFNVPEVCANSVEFLGDELPAYGGDPSGGFTELNGTVKIIGSPVTFRAYVYIPDEDGYASTSLNIGGNGNVGVSRYVELESPNYGNAYSETFILPAGDYTWQVIFNWNGTAGSFGVGGIDWTQ